MDEDTRMVHDAIKGKVKAANEKYEETKGNPVDFVVWLNDEFVPAGERKQVP